MRVLITGATGFIGGAIAREALARGWHVAAASRRAPENVGDIEWKTLDAWREAPRHFDVMVHAAALRHRHGVAPQDYLEHNVALTQEAIAVARACADRLVDVSSIAVYGWPKELPIDETRAHRPVNQYGMSKVWCEELIRASGLPFTIVEPSITYGPGDTNGMMDKILRMVARRRFVVPGLGRSRVQLVYIDDLARITLEAAVSPATLGETFICTYREPIRVADLVKLSARAVGTWVPTIGPPRSVLALGARVAEAMEPLGIFGSEPPITREKLATISVDRAYRIDKMRRLLGQEPQVGYEEGIMRTARALGLG